MAYSQSDTIRAIIAAAKGVAGDEWLYLAQAMLAVAWMESGWNAGATGDNGTSFGIFQLHLGGQADAFIQKYGRDALFDPYKQAQYKASQMWGVFRQLGGTDAMKANPGWFINEFEWVSQRPYEKPGYDRSLSAFETAVKATGGEWADVTPAETDPWADNDGTPDSGEQDAFNPYMGTPPWMMDFMQPQFDPVQNVLASLMGTTAMPSGPMDPVGAVLQDLGVETAMPAMPEPPPMQADPGASLRKMLGAFTPF